jgi:hypothetical protein
MGQAQAEQDCLIDGDAQTCADCPCHQGISSRGRKERPVTQKVVTGLIWRLEREAEPVGYRIPGYSSPTFLLKLPYRLPVPRILRVVYEDHGDEFFIVLAEVEKLSQADEG